jgi:hypothetical protein
MVPTFSFTMISTNQNCGKLERREQASVYVWLQEVHEWYLPEGLALAAIIIWIKTDKEIILKAVYQCNAKISNHFSKKYRKESWISFRIQVIEVLSIRYCSALNIKCEVNIYLIILSHNFLSFILFEEHHRQGNVNHSKGVLWAWRQTEGGTFVLLSEVWRWHLFSLFQGCHTKLNYQDNPDSIFMLCRCYSSCPRHFNLMWLKLYKSETFHTKQAFLIQKFTSLSPVLRV